MCYISEPVMNELNNLILELDNWPCQKNILNFFEINWEFCQKTLWPLVRHVKQGQLKFATKLLVNEKLEHED